jgi:DnaK suppressor protein
VDRFDPEVVEPEAGADDVDDRVERAHLVELDVVGRDAVDAALGLGEPREDRECVGAHPIRQPAPLEERTNVAIRPMRVVVVMRMPTRLVGMLSVHAHVEFRRADSRPRDALSVDRDAVEAERGDRVAHAREREAEIEQRAHGHVAAHAGERVEICDLHPASPIAPPPVGWYSVEGFGAHHLVSIMRKRDLSQFRTLLLGRRQELLDEAVRTLDGMGETRETFPDPTDRATLEDNRNLLLRIRDRERKLVSKIDEAIGRIEDGSYGKCEECGGDIGIERLKARPVTTLCIDCKSLQETQERKLRLQ